MAQIGRPPSSNPRRNAVPVRFADDELAAIRAAADTASTTVGDWLRTQALAAARRAQRK